MKASPFTRIAYAVALLACSTGTAQSQSFPAKPIRVITSAAGGGNDLQARLLTQALHESLGWTMVVDNRGGAGGEIAMESVARAAPDGYTLLFYGSSLWTLPLIRKASFDPVKDFSPVSLTAASPNLLVVHGSLPVKSVRDVIALARSRPGELSYASGGVGAATHLAAAVFASLSNTKLLHVPYKSNVTAYTDLISGQVHMMFMSASGSSQPQVKSGRLRIIAVTSAQPSALFPGVPTIAATVPGYAHNDAYGLLAPARTPDAILKRLSDEISRIFARSDTKNQYLKYNLEAVGSTPEQFAAAIAADMSRLGKVIKEAGITAD